MRELALVTLLWAFSFSLIGEVLAGHVDSDFAVLTRIVLAGLAFAPFTAWKRTPAPLALRIALCGSLQFGITYLCLYRSFAYLSVPEVLLFTIFTPLFVTWIDDALNRRFSPGASIAAVVAVIGAAIIRYDDITENALIGFGLLQIANATFAAGQVGYAHAMRRYRVSLPPWKTFGWFYLGALVIALPSFLIFGNPQRLPTTALQWGVLLWLGLAASGAGMFFWNRGATKVDAGTLAVMNNALIPAGLVVNLLIWSHHENLLRLLAGGVVMAAGLVINTAFERRRVHGRQTV